MLIERAREPVEQVLEAAGDLIVVFGGEEPEAVGVQDGSAGGGDRLGRGPFDVLVHKGDVVPVEVRDLGSVADDAFDLAGELTVERVLAQRAHNHENSGHTSSFRVMGTHARRFCKIVPPRCSLLPTKSVYIKSPRKTAIGLSVVCLGNGRGRVGLVLVLPGCGRTAVHAVEFRGGVRGRRVPRGDGVMPVPAVVGCCLAPWRRRPLPDVRASAATWPVAPPTVVGRGGHRPLPGL